MNRRPTLHPPWFLYTCPNSQPLDFGIDDQPIISPDFGINDQPKSLFISGRMTDLPPPFFLDWRPTLHRSWFWDKWQYCHPLFFGTGDQLTTYLNFGIYAHHNITLFFRIDDQVTIPLISKKMTNLPPLNLGKGFQPCTNLDFGMHVQIPNSSILGKKGTTYYPKWFRDKGPT